MKVSVALATYNGEKYIYEQLDSIFKQLYRPDEVIISDDNSKDKTKKIVLEFISNHNLVNWKFIENKRDHGVANNFLNALNNVTGDIIFLSDQDDIWNYDKVKSTVEAFDLDTSCVISSISYINQNGERINEKTTYTKKANHKIDLDELCSVCSYLGMSSAFRRNVVEKTDKRFMLNTSHDWALFIQACNSGKIKYIGKVLQKYRQHSDNASTIKDNSRRNKRIKFIERQIDILSKTTEFEETEEAIETIERYKIFLSERIKWIKNSNCFTVLFHYRHYKRMRYTLRNIIADFIASL